MPAKRCPDDFELTDELAAWTKLKTPLVNASEFLEEFRDIEFYRPHTDWPATWRNLCRKRQRELERFRPAPVVNVEANRRESERLFADMDAAAERKRQRLMGQGGLKVVR